LIGLPFPLLLGIISGLLNIIPYLGPLLTLVPVGLAAFLGGGTNLAIWAMGVVLIVQLIDNAVLQTWLVSQFVDVHPVMAFIVTLVFGELLGPVGMVIGIPAYVISKILIGGLWDYVKALQRHEQILSYQKSQ
jgi:predicted PurR-regulated permease PerM